MLKPDNQQQKNKVKRPFVIFRMPGSSGSSIYSGKIKPIILQEAFNLHGFILSPFINSSQNPTVFLEPDAVTEIISDIPDSLIDQMQLSESLPEIKMTINTDRETYIQDLKKLIELLKSGEANKVVISRTTVIESFSNQQLIRLYNTLCKTYPNAFVYIAHIQPYGIWMGATPETLISCHDSECNTMALAGTRKSGSQSDWGVKEREEQNIVSKYIQTTLAGHRVHNLEVSGPFTKQAGAMEHLCTNFSFGTPDDETLVQIINSLHPTPAVCGIPKAKALQFISQFESHNREYYTGFLGPVNFRGKTDLFVNLRCMKITSSKMILFAGGGITKDSVPEKEWEETELKAQTLLSVIEKVLE
ncbi:MAG: chorismate-binding protein [Bacteroidales bacterium]|nr:chorismate-binding protein [Bacteroidales bacterium]